ncbi:MAG: phenylalanine 4-monooxygenase, partial [Flavobacteriaceae bacterium]
LNITGIRNAQGKLILIRLRDCTVTYKEECLFLPEHGIYDMIIGKDIISAFAGAADCNSFPNLYAESSTLTIKPIKNDSLKVLEKYYSIVRDYRNNNKNDPKLLRDLFEKVKDSYPKEWLLLLEIMEVSKNAHLIKSIHKHLEQLIILNSKLSSLITDGIQILKIDDQ